MRKISILSLLSLFILISCERDDPDFVGPSLVNLFGEFSILEDFDITNRVVDFDSESTAFTAVFSKEVDWEVHITGLETGAIKSITGFGSILDASNAKWTGTTTILPQFNIETCAVELRVPSDTIVIMDTLEVTGNREASGFVIADFEDAINPDWNIFAQSGADMTFNIANDIVPGQGNNYYDMAGEVTWDWLIGLLDFPASAYGSETFDLNPDPAAVYFNVMLYLPDDITNEVVLFQFREDDNNDGTYTDGAEDLFAVELNNDLAPGWQLISVKYSDLQTLVNGAPAAAIGNGLREPNKLNQISVLMLANPNSGYSQTLMDYLVFTENGPLNP